MGLDAPDIHQSIHWGPSESIQAFVQESGRCGRDGMDSVLYFRKSDVSKGSRISDTMKLYCRNSGFCRRKLLMKEFAAPDTVICPEPIHKCCDICQRECMCTECRPNLSFTESEMSEIIEQDDTLTTCPSSPVQEVKKGKNTQLHKALLDYRNELCKLTDERGHKLPLLFGEEITTGLLDAVICDVVKNKDSIKSIADVTSLGVVSESHACSIYDIIKSAN